MERVTSMEADSNEGKRTNKYTFKVNPRNTSAQHKKEIHNNQE